MTRTSTLIVRADPSRSTSLLLQHAQHLGLRLRAHVADFVEEDRAAVGLLELADLLLGGAGERPLLVAEQLRLDQLLGNRGAVHLHERARGCAGCCGGWCARPAPCRRRSRPGSAPSRWSAPRCRSPSITCCSAGAVADHLVALLRTAFLSERFSSRSRRESSALRRLTSTRSLRERLLDEVEGARSWSPRPRC